MAAALVVGALAGLFISVLIVEARIYSLIASLSVIGLFTGLAMTFSDNLQIPLARQDLQQLIFYRGILGLPISVWIMFLLFGLGYVMLNHTRLGAHIYATGANYTAARLSGVPVSRDDRITLMMSGGCRGPGGFGGHGARQHHGALRCSGPADNSRPPTRSSRCCSAARACMGAPGGSSAP